MYPSWRSSCPIRTARCPQRWRALCGHLRRGVATARTVSSQKLPSSASSPGGQGEHQGSDSEARRGETEQSGAPLRKVRRPDHLRGVWKREAPSTSPVRLVLCSELVYTALAYLHRTNSPATQVQQPVATRNKYLQQVWLYLGRR